MSHVSRFTSHVLRFTAFTALLSACAAAPDAPDVGESLYRALIGGEVIGAATLLRFYTWHIVGLIVPMIFLVGWHAFRVRRDGGISHPARAAGAAHPPRIGRNQLVRTETLAFFLTLATLIVISVFFDAPLGNPPDQALTSGEIKAPWIFLWVQELLRVWPPAIAGVLVPLLLTALISAVPLLDRRDEGIAEWFNRPGRAVQIAVAAAFLLVAALTLRAALR